MGRCTIQFTAFCNVTISQVPSQPCDSTKTVSVHSLHLFISIFNHSCLCLFVKSLVHSFHLFSWSLGCKVLSSSLFEVLLWHRLKQCSLITAMCDACLARGVSACWNAASAVLITNDTKRRRLQALASQQVWLPAAEPQQPCLVSFTQTCCSSRVTWYARTYQHELTEAQGVLTAK